MAIPTLITPAEVVRESPADVKYPTDVICNLIPKVEQEFGYECLGETLYEWLLDNSEPYPDGAAAWIEGEQYGLNAYAVRNGCLFKSLLDCNRNDPLKDPDNTWEAFKKFGTNDCANEFWENYLRPVLGLKIFARSLNYTTRKAGTGGLTLLDTNNFNSQGFRSANKGELAAYKEDILKDEQTAVNNMIRWAKKKITSGDVCDVPLNSILECGLCKPSSASKRRWGFAH